MNAADRLALFGGAPLYKAPKPVGQLAAPSLDRYLAYLRDAFEAGTMIGHAMSSRLETILAQRHGVRECVTFANAGVALILLMRILSGGRGGNVLMPAFSYRGLPHFAQWAGQVPRFCDVEVSTHGLDAASVADAIDAMTTAILAVNNVNSACNINALQALSRDYDVPLFFDSVYGLGATFGGVPLGGFGRAEVFSMHATKLLNGFEGGYVASNDRALTDRLRAARDRSRASVALNDMHAAMALASLEDLDQVIARNERRYRRYEAICNSLPGVSLLPYHNESHEQYNYEMAIVEIDEEWPLTRDETVKLLRAEGAAITSYYSPPLHRSMHAPQATAPPYLPVSESLATRFLQLPVGEHVTIDDIDKLGEYLSFVYTHGDEIAFRMRESK